MEQIKKKSFMFMPLLLWLCGCIYFLVFQSEIAEPVLSEEYMVSRVIDGDTIELEDGTVVRLIGIDAPESVHPDESRNLEEGKESSEYLKNLLTGKTVQLEYDKESTDKYGRTLAYVYYQGEMVEDIILRDGMARTLFIAPNTKYKSQFLKLEKAAKENDVGIWKRI